MYLYYTYLYQDMILIQNMLNCFGCKESAIPSFGIIIELVLDVSNLLNILLRLKVSLDFVTNESVSRSFTFVYEKHPISFQYISHVHFYKNNVKYVDANLDAPDNAISDNESSSEMLTSQSQIPE